MRVGRVVLDHDIFTGQHTGEASVGREVAVRVIFWVRARAVRPFFQDWVFNPAPTSSYGLAVETGLVVNGCTVRNPANGEECLWIGDARPDGPVTKQAFIPWSLVKMVVWYGRAGAV